MDLTLGHTRLLVDECERQVSAAQPGSLRAGDGVWETARTMKPVVEAFWKAEA